jgi:hypothetical protein
MRQLKERVGKKRCAEVFKALKTTCTIHYLFVGLHQLR